MTDFDGMTIKQLLELIIGKYEPNLAPDGSVLGGLYSVDFEYLAALVVLLLFIYLTFKALYCLLSSISRRI